MRLRLRNFFNYDDGHRVNLRISTKVDLSLISSVNLSSLKLQGMRERERKRERERVRRSENKLQEINHLLYFRKPKEAIVPTFIQTLESNVAF